VYSATQQPRIPPGIRVERQGEHHLLLHPQAPRWALVNRAGLEVAHLCDGKHTPAEISEAMASLWSLDRATALADVQLCLRSLARAGLLDGLGPCDGSRHKRGWRLHLHLTRRCNLRCRHCAVVDRPGPRDRLSTAGIRSLIDQAVEAGVESIAFGGGEPLLREDGLELVEHSARQVMTLVATNGTLLDDRKAGALAGSGVTVQVSLDGASASTHDAVRGAGSFARTWRGIERLQAREVENRLALNVTLMRPNIQEVPELLALTARRQVSGVRFSGVQPMGRASAIWSELCPEPAEYAEAYRFLYLSQPPDGVAVSNGLAGLEVEPPDKGMWCQLGHILIVDSGGDIYPCSLLTDPRFCLGNVADTPLAKALESPRLQQLVARCEQRKDEIEECRKCAWRQLCQASCPGEVWLRHGTFWSPGEMCDLRRELFRRVIHNLVAPERLAEAPNHRSSLQVPTAQ